MTRVQSLFAKQFPSLSFEFNYVLALRSYFKIGGQSEIFYSANDEMIARELLSFCHRENIRCTILGGASNVIISDNGLNGLVLHLDFQDLVFLHEDEKSLRCKAGAGVKTAYLVAKVASRSVTGLEGFIGVPGTIGGAIYNNAHYLNALISDTIVSIDAFDNSTNQMVTLSKQDCHFAYERSIFQSKSNLIIFSAIFELQKDQLGLIQARLRESKERRERKQPLNMPSCGCVFQNPANTPELKKQFPQFIDLKFIPAGFLIETAGLKGLRVGGVEVSDKHAAFFVNVGHGKAEDVKQLVKLVKAKVKALCNVDLKEEVFYLD